MKCLVKIDTDCDKVKLDYLLNKYYCKYTYCELKVKLKIKNEKDIQKFFNYLL